MTDQDHESKSFGRGTNKEKKKHLVILAHILIKSIQICLGACLITVISHANMLM